MRKSYHLSPDDLKAILRDHFAAKGEAIGNVDFRVVKTGNDWGHWDAYPVFSEAIVYIKDEPPTTQL